MKFLRFTFQGLLCLVLSCAPKNPVEQEKISAIQETTSSSKPDSIPTSPSSKGDNSKTSLDWNGTYTGTIPCGHCEGITVWLTLNLNETFEFKTSYLGLNDARDEIFTGKFTWDASGSRIQLLGLIGDYPGRFFIGENQIWYLDAEGNRFSGPNAKDYLLKKI